MKNEELRKGKVEYSIRSKIGKDKTKIVWPHEENEGG